MKTKLSFLVSLILINLPFNVFAKENSENKGFFNADIFSLSKKKESAFDTSAAVYVLGSEDIRRSGVSSIPEALRLVPGLQVAQIDGNKWAISSRGFNHQYSSKLLIMVDGLVVYTPIFSGALWDNQDYVIEDIDRIEVIRGPGGSIWGANAMDGIINIITKNSTETQGGYMSQMVGNNEKSITEARYGGKISDLNTYRIYAKHTVRGGFTKLNDGTTNNDGTANNNGSRGNNDGIVSDRAGFRYDIASSKDSTLSVYSDFFNSKAHSYFSSAYLSDASGNNKDKDTDGGNIVVNWNKTLSTKSSFILQAYFNYVHSDIQIIDIREKASDIDFQHFYNFSKENQFIWGLGYKNLQDSIKTKQVGSAGNEFTALQYTPSTRNIAIYSAFVQDKIGLIANELYLTLGSKFEVNEQTGFEYQPNARLAYYPSRNQTLWTAVSRAIRTPTRGEDGITAQVAPGVAVLQGAPTSVAETVTSYEIGYRVKPTYTTSIDLATHYNEYSHLGTFDADSNGTPTASNNGYAKTYGFELSGKWQALDSLRFETSYDFLKTDIRVNAKSNENLPIDALNTDKMVYFNKSSPRNQFRFRSLYNVNSKVEFDNTILYVDSLPAKTNVEKGVPAYIRLDTRLGYLPRRGLDLSFGIRNLLDDRHQEFSAGLFNNKVEVGRTFYAKVAVQF